MKQFIENGFEPAKQKYKTIVTCDKCGKTVEHNYQKTWHDSDFQTGKAIEETAIFTLRKAVHDPDGGSEGIEKTYNFCYSCMEDIFKLVEDHIKKPPQITEWHS